MHLPSLFRNISFYSYCRYFPRSSVRMLTCCKLPQSTGQLFFSSRPLSFSGKCFTLTVRDRQERASVAALLVAALSASRHATRQVLVPRSFDDPFVALSFFFFSGSGSFASRPSRFSPPDLFFYSCTLFFPTSPGQAAPLDSCGTVFLLFVFLISYTSFEK